MFESFSTTKEKVFLYSRIYTACNLKRPFSQPTTSIGKIILAFTVLVKMVRSDRFYVHFVLLTAVSWLEHCSAHSIYICWMNKLFLGVMVHYIRIYPKTFYFDFLMLLNLEVKKPSNVYIGPLPTESNHSQCVNNSMCKVYSYVKTTWVSSTTSHISPRPTVRRAKL